MPILRCLGCVCVLCLATASCTGSAGPGSEAAAHGAATSATFHVPPATGPGIPAGAEWAAWINRDVEINLQNLPHQYSCNDLWYKLHAVLLAIGAREYMAIHTYNCGKGAAGGGRSPMIDLRFLTLRPVTGAQAVWANTRAINTTIRLAPGRPQRLDASDCDLIEQLQGSLLAYLGLKITSSHFACSGPSSRHAFDLSVQILQRWPNTVTADTGAGAHK